MPKSASQIEAEIAEALRARKWQTQIALEDSERRERLARRAASPTAEQLYEEYQADVAAGISHGEPRGRAREFRRDKSTRRHPHTAMEEYLSKWKPNMTVREINAIVRAADGRNVYLLRQRLGEVFVQRVVQARTRGRGMEVRSLNTGLWVPVLPEQGDKLEVR